MQLISALLASATLAGAIRASTPLVLAAMGGMFCERGGVIQLGLEGIMLSGAFAAVVTSFLQPRDSKRGRRQCRRQKPQQPATVPPELQSIL